jgi:hypothetical protein
MLPPVQTPLLQSDACSQRSQGLPSRQIEPPTQIRLWHWLSFSQRLPAEPSEQA